MYDVRQEDKLLGWFTVAIGIVGCAAPILAQAPGRAVFPPDIIPRAFLEDRDGLRADPLHYRLEFENNRVRVLRLTLQAGEETRLHDAADALAICLSECHVHLAGPARQGEDDHLRAGETRWLYGSARTERNLGKPLEMLFVESKPDTK